MSLDPATILKDLYASEIDWRIATFWNCGFRASLGDGLNGIEVERDFVTLAEAATSLAGEAVGLYPDSAFARKHGALFTPPH